MTRESKLAIILGFAVVLVVAALISDHFSHARAARLGMDVTSGTPADFGAGTPGPAGPVVTEVVNNRPPPIAGPLPSPRPPVGPERPKAGPPAPAPTDEPDERAIADASLPTSDGSLKKYQVRDNDSLYKISKVSYNDGRLWEKLAEYNKDRVGPRNTLRVGSTLLIPPRDVLEGKARLHADEGPGTGLQAARDVRLAMAEPRGRDSASATPPGPKKEAASEPKFTLYTVRRGDHLSTIARSQLGSSKRIADILALNPDIADEDSLDAGAVIKLPRK